MVVAFVAWLMVCPVQAHARFPGWEVFSQASPAASAFYCKVKECEVYTSSAPGHSMLYARLSRRPDRHELYLSVDYKAITLYSKFRQGGHRAEWYGQLPLLRVFLP